MDREEYKYGFKNEDVSILKTDKGLNEAVVREISRLKNEPEWMLEFRLKSLEHFLNSPLPHASSSTRHGRKQLKFSFCFLRCYRGAFLRTRCFLFC